jgi:hypothetical protein
MKRGQSFFSNQLMAEIERRNRFQFRSATSSKIYYKATPRPWKSTTIVVTFDGLWRHIFVIGNHSGEKKNKPWTTAIRKSERDTKILSSATIVSSTKMGMCFRRSEKYAARGIS